MIINNCIELGVLGMLFSAALRKVLRPTRYVFSFWSVTFLKTRIKINK